MNEQENHREYLSELYSENYYEQEQEEKYGYLKEQEDYGVSDKDFI